MCGKDSKRIDDKSRKLRERKEGDFVNFASVSSSLVKSYSNILPTGRILQDFKLEWRCMSILQEYLRAKIVYFF